MSFQVHYYRPGRQHPTWLLPALLKNVSGSRSSIIQPGIFSGVKPLEDIRAALDTARARRCALQICVLTNSPVHDCRRRDLALLTLPSDCGLRSQEAANLQLRDIDLDREHVSCARGQAVALPAACRLRRPARFGGSDGEREPFLLRRRVELPSGHSSVVYNEATHERTA